MRPGNQRIAEAVSLNKRQPEKRTGKSRGHTDDQS
jgi:hypothetical protein